MKDSRQRNGYQQTVCDSKNRRQIYTFSLKIDLFFKANASKIPTRNNNESKILKCLRKLNFFLRAFLFLLFVYFKSTKKSFPSTKCSAYAVLWMKCWWFCKAWSFWETESLSITWGVMLNFSMFSSFVFMDRSILSRIWESRVVFTDVKWIFEGKVKERIFGKRRNALEPI